MITPAPCLRNFNSPLPQLSCSLVSLLATKPNPIIILTLTVNLVLTFDSIPFALTLVGGWWNTFPIPFQKSVLVTASPDPQATHELINTHTHQHIETQTHIRM